MCDNKQKTKVTQEWYEYNRISECDISMVEYNGLFDIMKYCLLLKLQEASVAQHSVMCRTAGRVIDPAPGKWFRTKFISFARLYPVQYCLIVQNRGLKHQSFCESYLLFQSITFTYIITGYGLILTFTVLSGPHDRQNGFSHVTFLDPCNFLHMGSDQHPYLMGSDWVYVFIAASGSYSAGGNCCQKSFVY